MKTSFAIMSIVPEHGTSYRPYQTVQRRLTSGHEVASEQNTNLTSKLIMTVTPASEQIARKRQLPGEDTTTSI